jgi:glycosyltransferase involved in cell wall biosynthesis
LKRLAIIITHPIQYYAPVFALLSNIEGIKIKVFYTWEKEAAKFDRDFGKEVEWDIPLLDGYDYSFVSNGKNMGRRFWDVKNPGLNAAIEDWKATSVLVIGWNYRSHLKAMFYFKNRVPVLFRGDSTVLDETKGVKTRLRRIFLKFIYRKIDYALYVGTANKKYFLQHGIKESQLVFAPHAIDNKRFSDLSKEQEAFIINTRASLNIGEDCITIIYCGKLSAKKNPLLLVDTFKKTGNKKLHLIIVGNGELEESVKNEIAENDRIHMLPFQNQTIMPAVYRLGQIYCLPSRGPGETWGLGVNEAMACGLAVLVSDKVGCAYDLIEKGVNGYIFDSGNTNDLLQKLSLLAQDKNRLTEMGKASLKIIQPWSFECIVSALNQVINQPGQVMV